MKEWVAIIGAGSGIAKATARALARRRRPLILLGRDEAALDILAEDIRIRSGVEVKTVRFDAVDEADVAQLPQRVLALAGGVDGLYGVLLCYGIMPPQEELKADSEALRRMMQVNYVSAVCILQDFANRLAGRGSGVIAGISSVAGERGRASNYLYGSSKAGLSVFLNGLRHALRLSGSGLSVLTIHPGMVATAMTDGIVDPRSPLLARPEAVGERIAAAMEAARDGVLHVPWFWRWILLVIRCLPAKVFHRTRL